MARSSIASPHVVTTEPYVAYVWIDGEFESYVGFVGTRQALIARGIITEATRIPNGRGGTVETIDEKITARTAGQLRVRLHGPVAARRDREFHRFMRAVLGAEASYG